jgi:hypothetical protein
VNETNQFSGTWETIGDDELLKIARYTGPFNSSKALFSESYVEAAKMEAERRGLQVEELAGVT